MVEDERNSFICGSTTFRVHLVNNVLRDIVILEIFVGFVETSTVFLKMIYFLVLH